MQPPKLRIFLPFIWEPWQKPGENRGRLWPFGASPSVTSVRYAQPIRAHQPSGVPVRPHVSPCASADACGYAAPRAVCVVREPLSARDAAPRARRTPQ